MISVYSTVRVQFHNPLNREECATVLPRTIGQQVPDWAAHDPMFTALQQDGSLQIVLSNDAVRTIEKDPVQGTMPDGKKAKTTEKKG